MITQVLRGVRVLWVVGSPLQIQGTVVHLSNWNCSKAGLEQCRGEGRSRGPWGSWWVDLLGPRPTLCFSILPD